MNFILLLLIISMIITDSNNDNNIFFKKYYPHDSVIITYITLDYYITYNIIYRLHILQV